MKAARQQPNEKLAAVLCDVRTLARRVYREQLAIEEQMVLTSVTEDPHHAKLRCEFQESKPASPDVTLAMALEANASMKLDPSLENGFQATLGIVQDTPQ